ncbi:DUF6193 family natural product biosynthesis protein [Nonomuraea indica]|uniref:DUF6193 family natural product biosynthesis protein n=1 Tax=Nonomuraea indica TaxID=1581193 RepID=A0ABW8A397_9ACTN
MNERHDDSGSTSSPEEVLDSNLYGDLIQAGGLASAIATTASTLGIQLGPIKTQHASGRYSTAEISSERGNILVLLGVERRAFSINISNETLSWASGATDNLATVTRMAHAWQVGISLRDLINFYPFMRYDRIAEAHEQGNPVEFQWMQLLADPEYREARDLLTALHSQPELSGVFPYFSHKALRLTSDPYSRTGKVISVCETITGSLAVEIVGVPETRKEVDSLHQMVELVILYLNASQANAREISHLE